MKPADVKWRVYIHFDVENNGEDPKIEVGYHVRISVYKNIFPKGYTSYWYEEVL